MNQQKQSLLVQSATKNQNKHHIFSEHEWFGNFLACRFFHGGA
jgi:hypothetical protein